MGKIVNGIDLDTGEIVDADAAIEAGETESITEIDSNPDLDEKVELLSYIWPKKLISFVDDKSGYISCETMNWHADVKMSISLRFDFAKKKLSVFPNGSRNHSIEIPTKMIFNIDSLKAGSIELIQVPQGHLKYKATFNFRKRINDLAYDHVNFLQHRLYKITMLTKIDAQIYARLDHKVLVDDSLIEKVIDKKPTHVLTTKNGEKFVYLYQSVLEEKTPAEIKKLLYEQIGSKTHAGDADSDRT